MLAKQQPYGEVYDLYMVSGHLPGIRSGVSTKTPLIDEEKHLPYL